MQNLVIIAAGRVNLDISDVDLVTIIKNDHKVLEDLKNNQFHQMVDQDMEQNHKSLL